MNIIQTNDIVRRFHSVPSVMARFLTLHSFGANVPLLSEKWFLKGRIERTAQAPGSVPVPSETHVPSWVTCSMEPTWMQGLLMQWQHGKLKLVIGRPAHDSRFSPIQLALLHWPSPLPDPPLLLAHSFCIVETITALNLAILGLCTWSVNQISQGKNIQPSSTSKLSNYYFFWDGGWGAVNALYITRQMLIYLQSQLAKG